MDQSNLEKQRILSEKALTDKNFDFTAKFMAVYHLQTLSESNPEVINSDTISLLEKLLIDSEFTHRTQAYFMYKEVANTLCSIILRSKDLSESAFNAMKNLLGFTSGHSHRATAEALGSLPFSIQGPKITDSFQGDSPSVTWQRICDEVGLVIADSPRFVGRSLTAMATENKLIVIKLARENESIESLQRECAWMEYLMAQSHCFSLRFNIPQVIKIDESHVFRLMDVPIKKPGNASLHRLGYAIGFVADGDYYRYPNETSAERVLSKDEFREVISRNAWLLGNLSSQGIIHSAPIPLFHNRVQRDRRRDSGLYEWPRAGRLDRWLESCSYPNLGLTGVRDFEHFISFNGKSRILYRHIGIHMLSLLLIVGSYFRNKDVARVGFDSHGKPVDARDLFDREFLKKIIYEIFCNYYRGFVSDEYYGKFPMDLDKLADRMIDEMGVDHHMEEILRSGDQTLMTDEEFTAFLRRRGFSTEKIKSYQKGAQDIVFHSGPHLGEFNHPISLPELIEAVGTMSCLCIAGRYANLH